MANAVKLIKDVQRVVTPRKKMLHVWRGIKKISTRQEEIGIVKLRNISTRPDPDVGSFIREQLEVTGSKKDKIIAKEVFEVFKSYNGNNIHYNIFKKHMGMNGHTSYQLREIGPFRDKVVFHGLKIKVTLP